MFNASRSGFRSGSRVWGLKDLGLRVMGCGFWGPGSRFGVSRLACTAEHFGFTATLGGGVDFEMLRAGGFFGRLNKPLRDSRKAPQSCPP